MSGPNTGPAVSRRRALGIFALGAGAVLGCRPGRAIAAAPSVRRFVWSGMALGGPARIVLYHADRNAAERALAACVAEIARLEAEFSLYRTDSALSRLNRTGRLAPASHDMVALLAHCRRFGDLTAGAFDVSIQPLWRLYAEHFANDPDAADAPPDRAVAAARALVDYRRIEAAPERVRLAPGMALTLNGVAQGYITDRIADLLRARGWSNVLIDLGEIRALDGRPDGTPWRVGLDAGERGTTLALADRAVATSAGAGTPFDRDGRHHHLLDVKSGRSANRYRSVTVIAPRATTADALSTALYVMPRAGVESLLRRAGAAEARVVHGDGRHEWITG